MGGARREQARQPAGQRAGQAFRVEKNHANQREPGQQGGEPESPLAIGTPEGRYMGKQGMENVIVWSIIGREDRPEGLRDVALVGVGLVEADRLVHVRQPERQPEHDKDEDGQPL